jgi:hypothetical protein
MTIKTATPALPDSPHDPWAAAPASWLAPAGDRAARERVRQSLQKPRLWQYIIAPADRGLLAAVAGAVVDGPAFSFAARVLEELRRRGAAARTAEERARLHQLEVVLSRHVADLPDLLMHARALPPADPASDRP